MIFGFFFKLALSVIGCGGLMAVVGYQTQEKELKAWGIAIACIGVFIWFFSVGTDDEQTADIKAGLCIAHETELYQPPTVKDHRGNDFKPEAYLRTRYECPATEFYRAPQ